MNVAVVNINDDVKISTCIIKNIPGQIKCSLKCIIIFATFSWDDLKLYYNIIL